MLSNLIELRNRIEHRLELLEPKEYQALGVRFMRLRVLGSGIVWAAENRDGSPGHGHPDGRISMSDGRYVDVEVSKKKEWSSKIREDFPALRKLEPTHFSNTRELVFVTSHRVDLSRGDDGTAQIEEALRSDLVALLPLQRSQIRFVHLFEMAEELTRPEYAQLVEALVGESFHPTPFRTVGAEIRNRYGHSPIWQLAAESFDEGTLRVPGQLRDEVVRALGNSGEAVLWGTSGTGKSTLALAIGREYERRDEIALYLDFEATTANDDFVDLLVRHAPSLIILDNVHTLPNETFARLHADIRAAQEDGRLRGNVLYIGRHASEVKTRWKEDLALPTVTVECDSAMLECAFDHFVARARLNPSERARRLWCHNPALYGHNLVVFTIALHSHRGDLEHPPHAWESVNDVVRRDYLSGYSRQIRERLLTLSLICQTGLSATERQVDDDTHVFAERGEYGRSLIDRGIVLPREGWLQVFHPSFAALLVRASKLSAADSIRMLIGACEREPRSIAPLLMALRHEALIRGTLVQYAEQQLDALREWLADDERLASVLLATPPHSWRAAVNAVCKTSHAGYRRRPGAVGIVFSAERAAERMTLMREASVGGVAAIIRDLDHARGLQILSELMTDEREFVQQLQRTSIGSICTLLEVMESKSGPEFAERHTRLETLLGLPEYVEVALVRDLDGLRALLGYLSRRAEQEHDRAAGKTMAVIIRAIAERRVAKQIAAGGVVAAAHLLTYFAAFDDEYSREIVADLRAEIAAMPGSVLVQPTLTGLTAILGSLSAVAPELANRIYTELAGSDLRAKLDSLALRHLRQTFKFIDNAAAENDDARALAVNLRRLLVESEVPERLGETPLGNLKEALEYFNTDNETDVDVFRRMLAAVLDSDLAAKIANEPLMHLGHFIAYFSPMRTNPVAQAIVVRTANALSAAELMRKIRASTSQNLAAMIRSLSAASDRGDATTVELELLARLRAVLADPNIKDLLVAWLDEAFEADVPSDDHTLILYTVLRRFDPDLVESLLAAWNLDGRTAELIDKLRSLESLASQADLLRFVQSHRPATAAQLAAVLYSDPEELARRSANAPLDVLVTLVGLGKAADDPRSCVAYLRALGPIVDLSRLYSRDASLIVRFLFNAWQVLGSTEELDRFFDPRLVRVATALTYHWRESPTTEAALHDVLGMWGALSCFKDKPRPPARDRILPSPYELERAFASGRVQLTSMMGMMALNLRFSPIVAARIEKQVEQLLHANRFTAIRDRLAPALLAWLRSQKT